MNSNSIKKYVAEFIGTMVLVVFGCGTAMLVGCDSVLGCGYILTALAFGLVIVAMAYSVGNISGCHINPAVSLGVLLSGGMSVTDFIGYVIAQFAGALAGSGVLAAVFAMGGVIDKTGTYTVKAAEGSLLPVADVQTSFGFGANTMAGVGGNHFAGLIVEIILTAVFVFAILGVTSKKAGHGSFGGLVIGLTGTSVNPARSFGPAIVAMFTGNFTPIACLWAFILGPCIGAALAAICYKYLEGKKAA